MKKINEGLLDYALSTFKPSKYQKYASSMHVSPEQMKEIYESHRNNGMNEKVKDFIEKSSLGAKFRFLGDMLNNFLEDQKIHLLSVPEFETNGDFKEIVNTLSGKRMTKGMVKKFGIKTQTFGVVFLNNVHFLNKIYGQDLNMDLILNLDHRFEIYKENAEAFSKLDFIVKTYTLKRAFFLLTTSSVYYLKESAELIKWLSSEELDIVAKDFPRKFECHTEIHNEISIRIKYLKKNNRQLNQEIIFLDGLRFHEFNIEVPKDTADLKSTSDELNHCVHGYDERVIRKKCQILNLTRDGKRIYTIELVPNGDLYRVEQFKGYSNNSQMEGPEGYKLHRELIYLISLLKPNLALSSK